LLAHVARFGKPVILSTGMGSLAEVEAGVAAIEAVGNSQIVLLHCVSEYPADPAHVNLRAMYTLQVAFNLPVGYSDHTLGTEVALAAVARGACVIEKHLTLSRSSPGPDHRASIEPGQFSDMVRGIRMIEAALGSGRKRPTQGELDTAAVARKSLVAASDIPSGAAITDAMLTLRRPGTGIAPALRAHVVGRTARRPIQAGELIALEMLA
jgi:sialic acid synthase SpsE